MVTANTAIRTRLLLPVTTIGNALAHKVSRHYDHQVLPDLLGLLWCHPHGQHLHNQTNRGHPQFSGLKSRWNVHITLLTLLYAPYGRFYPRLGYVYP